MCVKVMMHDARRLSVGKRLVGWILGRGEGKNHSLKAQLSCKITLMYRE